jgi:hypothetical protein
MTVFTDFFESAQVKMYEDIGEYTKATGRIYIQRPDEVNELGKLLFVASDIFNCQASKAQKC